MTDGAPRDSVDKFPKLLSVGTLPIGARNNTGYTLSSMFRDWPEVAIRQVALRDDPDAERRVGQLPLPSQVAPLDHLARHTLGLHLPKAANDGMNTSVRARHNTSSKTRIMSSVRIANDLGPVLLPRVTYSALNEFGPDLIYSPLGGVRVMRLVLRISHKFNLPILPQFMDDWPSQMFSDGQLAGLARIELQRLFRQALERAPVLLTISDEMAREYEGRYGKPCVTVGNSLESGWGAGLEDIQVNSKRLTYAGGVHIGRRAVLEQLGALLDKVNNELEDPYELYVCAPVSDAAVVGQLANQFESIKFGGTVRQEDLPALLKGSGINVFVESSDQAIRDFTRLSISTKVPEYLAAGRPVIAFGPEGQASLNAFSSSAIGHYFAKGPAELEVSSFSDTIRKLAEAPTRPALNEWMTAGATRSRLRRASLDAVSMWGN